jgi:hypothetical protein
MAFIIVVLRACSPLEALPAASILNLLEGTQIARVFRAHYISESFGLRVRGLGLRWSSYKPSEQIAPGEGTRHREGGRAKLIKGVLRAP